MFEMKNNKKIYLSSILQHLYWIYNHRTIEKNLIHKSERFYQPHYVVF